MAARPGVWCLGLAVALCALTGCGGAVHASQSHSAPRPRPALVPHSQSPPPWLGLNYNSSSDAGGLDYFSSRGIVYDREGDIEVNTGVTTQNSPQFRAALGADYAEQMIPVIEIDPAIGPTGCPNSPYANKVCLPTTTAQIDALASGFVITAASVLHAFPGREVLFEPFDEPWNWGSPPGTIPSARAASEYAAVIAQILPAAREAGVPVQDIYVAAIGLLSDGTNWVGDMYRAQPCLQPGPGSCGPIGGWYIHPYGLPGRLGQGIGTVPAIRSQLRSGQDNIVVSEIGFCATDVERGRSCQENRTDIDGTSARAAAWLTETLTQAAAMHRAGWLKALLVWERAGTGWAMQYPNGTLTDQGRALVAFADSPAGS